MKRKIVLKFYHRKNFHETLFSSFSSPNHFYTSFIGKFQGKSSHGDNTFFSRLFAITIYCIFDAFSFSPISPILTPSLNFPKSIKIPFNRIFPIFTNIESHFARLFSTFSDDFITHQKFSYLLRLTRNSVPI